MLLKQYLYWPLNFSVQCYECELPELLAKGGAVCLSVVSNAIRGSVPAWWGKGGTVYSDIVSDELIFSIY